MHRKRICNQKIFNDNFDYKEEVNDTLTNCIVYMVTATVRTVFRKISYLNRAYIISDIIYHILSYTYPKSLHTTKGRKDKFGYFNQSILNYANSIYSQRFGRNRNRDVLGIKIGSTRRGESITFYPLNSDIYAGVTDDDYEKIN